jgi:outer membrane biosynthesis protein TonB
VGGSEADAALPELLVELVIDSAGKVRSAESAAPAFDASLKSEVGRWKFVPAFDAGHGVASHVYMLLSQKR